ncbi:PQQ-binding-like beta-propeller repeat protein [Kitasatospora sp. NPDC056138]|uniref:outer membrane protein assembly factor BamB family protein n=1 Tax=Kitasatospora sp. NPDC056138 TaxID=3345724 RepID=UPI0035E0ACD7
MAQDHSGTAGQEPIGYDYQQQPWYPPQQSAAAGDPWYGGQQQPYAGSEQGFAEHQGFPDQRGFPGQHGFAEHQGFPEQQSYAEQQGFAEQHGLPGQPGWAAPNTDPWQTGAQQQEPGGQDGFYAPGAPATDNAPFGTAPAYDPFGTTAPGSGAGADSVYGQYPAAEQQLYAPAGTDNGYYGFDQQHPADPTEQLPPVPASGGGADPDQGPPTAAFDPAAFTPFEQLATTAMPAVSDDAAGGPSPTGPGGRPGAQQGDHGGDTGPDGGKGKGSLADRARSAFAAVVSAEHGPGRRTLAIRAGAGAGAVLVLITAAFLATGGSSGSGSGGGATEDPAAAKAFAVAHAKAWTAQPAAAGSAGSDDTLVGSWLLAATAVRADSTGVHAYALADGKPAWTVAPPADNAAACGLSPTVNSNGLGVALFRPQADPKSPCTLLAAIDTKTGKTAWTKTLSDTKDPYSARVAVSGDKVIAVGDDKAWAWAAADGSDAWQYTGQGKFCTLSGGANGDTVLLSSSCADSDPNMQAVALNAADGKVKWWRGLNNAPKTVTVLSAEPAVVLTTGQSPTDDRVLAWGVNGDPATEIPVSGNGGRLDVARGSFSATPGVFFQGHTMVTTLTPAEGSPVAVTAYDLSTGKPLWKTAAQEKGKARAVGIDNGALMLAVDERLDQPAHLSRFALTGGQESTGGAYPQGTGLLLTSGRVLIGGEKVVAVPEHSANFGTATAFQAKG